MVVRIGGIVDHHHFKILTEVEYVLILTRQSEIQTRLDAILTVVIIHMIKGDNSRPTKFKIYKSKYNLV